MAKTLRQKGIIIKVTNKKTGKSGHILIAQKTGYMNVAINGKRFYYNKTATSKSNNMPSLKSIVTTNRKSKKKIVVKKKR